MKKLIIVAAIIVLISVSVFVYMAYTPPKVCVTDFDALNKTAKVKFGNKTLDLKDGVLASVEGRNGFTLAAKLTGNEISFTITDKKKVIVDSFTLDASKTSKRS